MAPTGKENYDNCVQNTDLFKEGIPRGFSVSCSNCATLQNRIREQDIKLIAYRNQINSLLRNIRKQRDDARTRTRELRIQCNKLKEKLNKC